MKDTYFTPESIEATAQRMLHEVLEAVPQAQERRTEFLSDPTLKGTALLVLDMQRYFLDPASHAYVPSAPAILPNILRLINTFADHSSPVIFTQHVNKQDNAGCMQNWWGDLLTADHQFAALIDECAPPAGGAARFDVKKSQYDAFHRTNLEVILKVKQIKRIVVTGVMTHLCCETTARAAFVRGFEVIFPVDATATYNEKFHSGTLQNLAHGFAIPITTDEFIEQL